MTSSQFSVTKSAGELVVPCEPTPSQTLLLSSIDRVHSLGSFAEVFWLYKHGQEAAKVIRQALCKALVPYYPMAGRLVRSDEGEVQAACTGDGVWFVEASAECSLEDVEWLEQPPYVIPKDQLLPLHPYPAGVPVMMQVTQFRCGGFVVGLVIDHTIADGVGSGQFMKAVAEIARGLEQPLVKPVWFREHFPNPPTPLRPPSAVPGMPLEFSIVDLSLDHINQLKCQFMEQTGQRCSAFEVTIAKLWQCRTRAIGQEAGVNIHLQFMAHTRHLLSHDLLREGGYYGNCTYPMMVTAPSGKIVNGSIAEIASLIRDAKKKLPDEFYKWANGTQEDNTAVPTLGYESMGVTDWSHMGYGEVDYGWGRPAYFTPGPVTTDLGLPPWCIVLKPPAPKQGSRLLTLCVKKDHLEAFRDGMKNLHVLRKSTTHVKARRISAL